MKKILLILFLFSATSLVLKAQNFPAKPNTLVNDYTGTLNANEIAQLEQKLVAFDDSTSIQVSVAIIKSLEGYEINEYGYQLGRAWGIGDAKKNTGVLFLVSIGDRKISIQTGYGMEGALPDAITKRIIENEVKPAFKEGNYFKGIDDGTNAIISYSKGEYKNDKPKRKSSGKGFPAGLLILIVIAIIFFLSRRGGGGGGSQVIGGRGGADLLWWTLLAGRGGSGGGGWGGGGSSGGGFGGGGGGFGGFGGGSFGGGGSSGSW